MTPYGLCQCGCGGKAPIAAYSHAARGWRKGQPKRFITGHNARGQKRHTGPRWLSEDRGFETPCWIWQMHRDKRGYGRVNRTGIHRPELAHRVFFEERYGWLPPEIHHRCGITACVNPEHLEPLANAAEHRRLEQAARTHCRRGHDYAEHGRFHKSGARYCRACERANERRRAAVS